MIHLFLKNTTQYHVVSQLKLQRKISKLKWNSHKILTLQLRYMLPVFWYCLWEHKIILIKWLWESEPEMKDDNSGHMTHSWVRSSILLWWLVLSLSSSVSSCPRQCCLYIIHILGFVLPFCELHTLPSFSRLFQTGKNRIDYILVTMSHLSSAFLRLYPGPSARVLSVHKTL